MTFNVSSYPVTLKHIQISFLISPVIHIIQAHHIVNVTKIEVDHGHGHGPDRHQTRKTLPTTKENHHNIVQHRIQEIGIIEPIDMMMTAVPIAIQMDTVRINKIDTIQV